MKKQDKRKAPAKAKAPGMSIDAILEQLADLKDVAIFLKKPRDDPDVMESRVAACEAATDILTALQDVGIKDPEQVRDLIHDYNALAEQYRKIKAGYSTNVKKRLRTIELSSGVTAKQIYSVQAGRSVEKLLHNKLENRLLGEFFAFPFERAKELLDEIVANYIPPVHGGEAMTARQIVEMATGYCGVSNSELARRLGWSPQLLNKRLNTGKFTVEEWEKIGEALGATARVRFTFPDGTEI